MNTPIAEFVAFPPHEDIRAGVILMIGARCVGRGEMTAPAGWVQDSCQHYAGHVDFAWHRACNDAEPATYVFVHRGWQSVEFVRGVVHPAQA